ncbi:MAG: hypothetical protein H0W40_15540 [Methylibium sp.]|uniref:hypothetical protein n=1 Tax=Methylibium sp. TaxID=2067992 RepID=UPI00183C2EC9|nr:hypothetical protein [Methylibium sp.]MBA3598772.1 hypothetical protein [Methylibium sp.]
MHLLTPGTAAELFDCVHTELDRFRANRHWYAVFLAVVAVGFALVALFKLDREFTDLPLLLLAGAVHSLGYVGLYLLIGALVVARLMYESTYSQLEAGWTQREAVRRPEQSFAVAYWRFVLVAAPIAAIVFTVLAALIVAVFFILPMQVDAVSEVLYAMLLQD